MSITLTALQKQRRDTAANWTAANPTLLSGEIGIESDTNKIKIGDGSTAWASLAYTPWSQLSAYPIVNADISSTAEIAVSKLADGTARQLLQTDAAGTGVEWTSNVDVPGTLDVTGAATFDSNVTIQGDLTVNGTETIINTQTLDVEDKNIVIGKVTTPSDVTADGGGITLKGTTDKTISWIDATDAWTFSEHVNIASAKEYRIAGTKVLDATSLGSGVVSSSLTSVGTIGTGVWQGTAISDTYLATISTAGKVSNSATTATSANTASAIVARDASGNFSAGTITANLSGNASTVTTNANLTGDVTSVGNATSIAAGVIVNADVNASAAIAGTKISPDFGSQTVTTTGVISAALGAAGTPSLTFTGDLNTGIYSPGADQVAISTGGSGRLFINSSGQVGVGVSPSATLEVNGESRFTRSGVASQYVSIAADGTDTRIVAEGSSKNLTIKNNSSTSSAILFDQAVASSYIFNQAGNERMRLDSSGRLGVGTSSPVNRLDVNGSISAAGSFSNTGYAPAVHVGLSGGNPTIGSGNNVASTYLPLVFTRETTTGSAESMRIDASGRLGIGTSSPQNALHAYHATDNAVLRLESGDEYVHIEFKDPTTTNIPYIGAQGNNLRMITGGAAAVTIDSSQRVGIGFTSVEAALHAGGNSASPVIFAGSDSGDVTYKFRQSRGTITSPSDTGSEGVRLSFEKRSTSSWASPIAQIYAAGDGSGADGYLEFLTKPSGGSATPRARIDSSGRLLVGTSTSRAVGASNQRSLQVEGTTYSNSSLSLTCNSTSDAPIFAFGRSRGSVGGSTAVTNGDELGYITFSGANGSDLSNYAAWIACQVDGAVSGGGANDMPGRLVFSTTADGASSPTERMRIQANGLVLIGTQTAYASGTTIGGGEIFSRITSDRALTLRRDTTDGTIAEFRRDATTVGTISVTTTATAYNTSSDYRLKENVTPVTNGITRLQQLKPSRFNFIADPDTVVDGFIAHEVQTVVPEAITGEKDAVDDDGNPIYQGIDQSKLVPLLTAALQEAVAKIESLEARLTAAGI